MCVCKCACIRSSVTLLMHGHVDEPCCNKPKRTKSRDTALCVCVCVHACVRVCVYKCPTTCCTPHTRLTKSLRKDQDQYHPNIKFRLFSNSSSGRVCNSSNGDTRCKARQSGNQTTSEGSQRPDTHGERGSRKQCMHLERFFFSISHHIISLPHTCTDDLKGNLLGQWHSVVHCEHYELSAAFK